MRLRAEHFDGFSEHLVSWTLEASNNLATIDTSWRQHGERFEKRFKIEFPDSRIADIARALSGLKAEYNGHVDDFPTYSLCVETEDTALKTVVHEGINWPVDEKRGLDSFMRVWRPLYRDVEKLMALPGRH